MGLTSTVAVEGTPALAALLERLAAAGLPSTLLMVDNQLVSPKRPPPAVWTEVRLKTPAGTITLRRQAGAVTLTVFGNADDALLLAKDQVGRALTEG